MELLSKSFNLEAEQIVIAPGNHDLSWTASRAAYKLMRREELSPDTPRDSYIDRDGVVELRDDEQYEERFVNFSNFYKAVKGESYPLEYGKQFSIAHLPAQKLLILGLNSAWKLDHHYKTRADIYSVALSNALISINESAQAYEGCLRIAVWHHPLTSAFEDRIKDHGFMERLAVNDFRIALHGHIHKADNGRFRIDFSSDGRGIDTITAGTFGAPVKEWTPGHPLQYNLLRVEGQKLTVETRRREELGGAWRADARWTPGKNRDPQPRYTIEL
ncbi:MAG: metallophosphoesterase [Pseudomonadota bacterium]|nr:metallophosphoesterase [Pseudomonadota bacterium]